MESQIACVEKDGMMNSRKIILHSMYHWQIHATLRCDRVCQWCDRLIGVVPWKNSDVLLDDICRAGKEVKSRGLKISWLRVSGGEPTLHPQLLELCKLLEEWKSISTKTIICTNKTIEEFPNVPEYRIRRSSVKRDPLKDGHNPNLISPYDMGLKTTIGIGHIPEYYYRCGLMRRCGQVFDAFGFTFCHRAGGIGRLIGIDPYSTVPLTKGIEDICRHCIYSIRRSDRLQLWKDVKDGKLKHPTETYRKGLERGPIELTRYQDR